MSDLELKFQTTMDEVGIELSKSRLMFAELRRMYDDETRGHHNLRHVEECVDMIRGSLRTTLVSPSLMEVAYYWHDVVYDATSLTNELESAVVAASRLTQAHLKRSQIATVVEFILTYQGGVPPRSEDAKYFRDIDYWIIGSPRERYKEYMRGIEKEYRMHFDGESYRAGRMKFLKGMLQLERIFLTDYFEARFREDAISNILYEIEAL